MREYCFVKGLGKFCLGFVLLIFSIGLSAQMDTCVTVDMTTRAGQKGEEICIQVKIGNFKCISSFQFSIAYDPTVVEPVKIQNIYNNLVSFDINSINIDNSKKSLRVLWSDPNAAGITINGEFVLFEVCFKLIGPPGSCSSLYLSNKPTAIEFVDCKDNVLCVKDLNDQDQIKIQVPTDLCVLKTVCGSPTGMGNITIKAWGGKEPYTVDLLSPARTGTISNSGGSHTFGNLASGSYSVKLTDGNGKDTTLLIDVPFSSDITVSTPPGSVTPPRCWNTRDGRISVNVSGGTAPLLLAWKPLNLYGISNLSGLGIGKYTLCVTDSFGCTLIKDFEFFQSEIVGTVENIKDATCTTANGVVLSKATGGNPSPVNGYSFDWSFNNRFKCATTIDSTCRHDSLPVGRHFVLITDSRSCQDTVWFDVFSSGNLSDSVIVDSVKCFGESNGIITVFAKSNLSLNLPINFQLFTIPNNTPIAGGVTNGDKFTSPGLATGSYKVIIKDNTGCEFIDTIRIEQPFILELIENSIDTTESCFPGMDARLDIRGSGGNSPYKYLWDFQNSTSSVLTGLSAGTYTVTITDNKGCQVSKSYNVSKPSSPTITGFTKQDISCGGNNNGCAEVLFQLGSGTLSSILWNTGDTTARICSLAVGTYIVTITNTAGCTAIDSVTLSSSSNSIFFDSVTVRNPTCPRASDGLILAFIKGGTAPYVFEWNGVVGNNILTNIPAGTYNLLVKDQSNCPPITRQITLTDPPEIGRKLTILKGPSCTSDINCDGSASLELTGIHPDFSILWSSREQEFTSRDTAVKLCGGPQFAIISNGTCTDTVKFDLPFPTPITSFGVIKNPSCYLSSDGSINLTSQGGKLNHTYKWENGTSSNVLSGLVDGEYRVTITDANNCTHIDSFRLRQPDSVRVSIIAGSTTDISCFGKDDGKIVTAWGGGNRGPARFTWIPNVSNDSLASNLPKGTYTVIVTDVNGCTGIATHTVNEPPDLVRNFSEIDTPNCGNDQIDFSVLNATGGAGPDYRFTINDGAPNAIGNFVPLFPGTYTIRVYDKIGCYIDTAIVIPDPISDLDLNFTIDIDTVQLGDSIRVEGVVNSRSAIDTIIWSPIGSVNNPLSTISFVRPAVTTMYTLTVIDENGCTATDKITIVVENDRKFFVPNVISPNDDGLNDGLEIISSNAVEKVEFVSVFDRWGAKVYEIENPDISSGRTTTWKGEFKGRQCNPGVYVYIIKVKFIDGASYIYRGDVTIIR